VDDSCPSHFKDEDWLQLRIIRNQWIPEPGQAEQSQMQNAE
jgi:hypothetical protein